MRGMQWMVGALGCAALVLAGCGAASAMIVAHGGGTRITLRAACPAGATSCDVSSGRDAAMRMLSTRLTAGLGISDATLSPSGANGIVVALRNPVDHAAVVPALTKRGSFATLDTPGNPLAVGQDVAALICAASCHPGQYRALFTEAQLDRSSVAANLDPQTQRPVITFGFAGAARGQFADYTAAHVGSYLTLAVDGVVVESAVIEIRIDGATEISGLSSFGSARGIAAELKAGPLPVDVSLVSEEQV